MRLARGYLLVAGAGLLVFGVLYTVVPSVLIDPMGFDDLAPEALTDLRATYGGMQIAIGAFLLWTAADAARQRLGLVLLSLLLPAVAAARAVGIVVDSNPTGLLVVVLLFEVLLAAFSWFVLWNLSPRKARTEDTDARLTS